MNCSRLSSFLLIICVVLFCTNCIDITEKLHLNKNGSGEYSLTLDMSEMLDNMHMMQQTLNSDSLVNGENIQINQLDTTILMGRLAEESKQELAHPEFWKKVSYIKYFNPEEKTGYVKFFFPFEDIQEIDYFYQDLDKIPTSDAELVQAQEMSNGKSFFGNKKRFFNLKKRTLTRLSNKTLNVEQATSEGEKDQMMDLMSKIMLRDATYTVVYTLPGNVRKTTMENAVVSGSTITLEVPMIKIKEEKIDPLAGSIKFRN